MEYRGKHRLPESEKGKHRLPEPERRFTLIQGGVQAERQQESGATPDFSRFPDPETAYAEFLAGVLADKIRGENVNDQGGRHRTLGSVADLETIARSDVSNGDFMAARSDRAAQRAAERAGQLGMHEQQPDLQVVPPPDDGPK